MKNWRKGRDESLKNESDQIILELKENFEELIMLSGELLTIDEESKLKYLREVRVVPQHVNILLSVGTSRLSSTVLVQKMS